MCNIELGGSDFELDSPSEVTEDLCYDTDTSVTTLLANVTNRVNPDSESCLPSKDCASLTPEVKDPRRKITPDIKAVILKVGVTSTYPTIDLIAKNLIILVAKQLNPLLVTSDIFLMLTCMSS